MGPVRRRAITVACLQFASFETQWEKDPMKKILTLLMVLGLLAFVTGVANANLLVNGNLDTVGSPIDGWSTQEFKTFSGDTNDLVTLEGFIAIGPVTSPPSAADLGGFVKAFNGNPTTGDLATLNLYQDVAGTAGQKYVLTGWIGAGVNYSGLLGGATQTQLAIDFDNDNDPSNGVIDSAITDVQAAGLASGGCCAFGAKQFTAMGTAPAGTTVVRARFSAIDMYSTVNPDQAAFIDDFSLTAVPEPATLALFGLAALGSLGIRRRSS
jgi:PEP-CTERM motif